MGTSRPLPPSDDPEAVIERLGGTPREIVSHLEQRGFRSLYVDGGRTIQSFASGLIQSEYQVLPAGARAGH